ncbi:MAG: hypothetical protein EOP82_22610 [Variovorax sp.]|nr:MAG: hypothetical protein EOP82_22610 [Variovorax sp.]
MKNIEEPINDGGEITVGAIGSIECAATAADGHNTLAMLVRRKGETLNALLKRLDKPSPSSTKMTWSSTRSTVPPIDPRCRQGGTAGRSR